MFYKSCKAVIGIQCRYSSSRLRGKAMLPILSTTVLGATILRSLATELDTYVLTSIEKSDDVIAKYATNFPIKNVIRGPLKNVQKRFRELAKTTKAEYIIRVTADNPFTDSFAILKLLEYSLNKKSIYSRFLESELPIGFHSECFQSDQLFLDHNVCPISDEHVTYALRRRSNHNQIKGLGYNLKDHTLETLSCTIDTISDYKKALLLSSALKIEDFSSLDLTKKLIKKQSEFINN